MNFSARTFFYSALFAPQRGMHQLPLIDQDETFLLRTSTVRFEPDAVIIVSGQANRQHPAGSRSPLASP
jgi:hypothetical protein